jgi:uncharacterized membrane protein/nitrite reductase/ring-hydroxylating ferredoxin subunit
MKSRASLKSHPLHPILVSFPIAFFMGTLGFDLAGLVKENTAFTQTAFYLEIAGILFGLLAAIPGIIDFVFVVPPKSSGKKRAAKHGLTNITLVILFTIAWFYRQRADAQPFVYVGLEIGGSALLVFAGWMGGTLVYRNQIGVDPRYAGAGKWKEIYIDKEDEAIEIASLDELQLNQMKLVHIKSKRIVVGRTEQGYVAFDDRCTHKGGSLAGGAMICGTVQCPWHGSQFDVQTGTVKAGPAKDNIQVYTLTEKNGKVYLHM